MNPGVYQQMAQLVESHWWYVYRRRLLKMVLDRHRPLHDKVGLDIGCGVGGELGLIGQYCREVVGLDKSSEALAFAAARNPGRRFIRGDINDMERLLPAGSCGLVTVLNVLYHRWIQSEDNVLRQICKVLAPGGVLAVTEPAFRCLYRRHDAQVMGARRYSLSHVSNMIVKAGFEVRERTYFNTISFFPAFALAAVEKFSRTTSDSSDGVIELGVPRFGLNEAMIGALEVERLLIRLTGRMPFGVSLLVTAVKPMRLAD